MTTNEIGKYATDNAYTITNRIEETNKYSYSVLKYATNDNRYTINVWREQESDAILLNLTKGGTLDFSTFEIVPTVKVLDNKDIYDAVYCMIKLAIEIENIVQNIRLKGDRNGKENN